ncbi:NUDIX domain-containing protein [Sphingobium sp. AN558]|uniref:NUDIX domain-containing protein n=1 Tax=Sphingobium sp. AN558 TaxID=3133442 RepID=UPI0030C5E9E0
METSTDQGRPAATIVIVRDRAEGPAEILMMERAATMVFAAGAIVFPGGGVDDSDRAMAAAFADAYELDEAAARIAAIRETLEECGLGVGLTGPVDADSLAEIRAGLAAGGSLGDLLGAHGLALALDQLVPFARWHPAKGEKMMRVYDARFYLARAPQAQVASADTSENVALFWCSAADMLSRFEAGLHHIIFPTRRNLERLAQFDRFEQIAAHAQAIPVEKVRPWIEERDGERFLCIPSHLGYPVITEPLEGIARF